MGGTAWTESGPSLEAFPVPSFILSPFVTTLQGRRRATCRCSPPSLVLRGKFGRKRRKELFALVFFSLKLQQANRPLPISARILTIF